MQPFKTSDIYLAASIMALGHKLSRTDRPSNDRRIYFVFESKNGEIDHISELFFSDKLMVPAQGLKKCWKTLRTLL